MYVRENEMFDEMLDSCYEDVTIGCCTFTASQILRACDPVAYQMGVNEYLESMEEEEDEDEEE